MPTPVTAARQCLRPDAARALDEAVGVARRRGHSQTTSLHAVSALLALPSSSLREACLSSGSSTYSPRLQFKALELCFGVALDRLPSSQAFEEPPISNSLMAAIRRSQANQRRQPESFHFHQQQQQQHSSLSCVKVELRHLTLSILDDPVVSRVFAEAGFLSYDIKMAIVRPPPLPLIRYRPRCPPIFLCNLPGEDSEPGRQSFSFPFPGFAGFSGLSDVDDICKKIGEILVKKSGRNPLLVGVCAHDAVRGFAECLQRGKAGVLPDGLSGLSFICIEKEISEFISSTRSEDLMGLRFQELGHSVENCSGSGLVVNIGDLKGFIADDSIVTVNYVVSQLTKLLVLHHGHLWLIAEATGYGSYLKLLRRFPSLEKDWDLQFLLITSLKPSISSMGRLYSRPSSLMESFVPFGGFFPTPSHLKGPLSSTSQSVSRCQLCNDKYEQELSSILKEGCTVSVGDQRQSSLSSWLHTAELSINQGLDNVKARDDGSILNSVLGLQRKWNDLCLHLHQSCRKADVNTYQAGSQSLPTFVNFPYAVDVKERLDNDNENSKNVSQNESGCIDIIPPISINLERVSTPELNRPVPVVSKGKSENFLSKLQVTTSKSEHLEAEGVWSSHGTPSSLNMPDGHASLSSATSVPTDLGLGSLYACTSKELKKPACLSLIKERQQDCADCSPTEIDVVNSNISNPPAQSPSYPGPDLRRDLDPSDFKNVWRGLIDKVGRQDEAIYAISQTIVRCRTEGERRHGANRKGGIWFNFLGPDRVAKKRTALALAEVIFGSEEDLICVDLSSEDCSSHPNLILDHHEMNNYDVKFRGKTFVDYIAGELSKKPLSVVFIENVEKADLLPQNMLSSAIRNGKFSGSHGREIGVNNVIFVTASRVTKGMKTFFSGKQPFNFSEERILGAQCWQMQILIGGAPDNSSRSNNSNVLVTPRKGISDLFVNKRKLIDSSDPTEQHETLERVKRVHRPSTINLDLNLPVEELEGNDTDNRNYGSDAVSENSAWLEEFFDQMDETVTFKTFDFDALADKILKEINKSFCRTIGCNGLLEIDAEVMEHILKAAWLSDRHEVIEDWVNNVLGRCFAEARQRYSFLVRSVLKLVSCEGLLMEEQAPGICLPAQIMLN